ncbi:DUF4260 family protein [Halostella litorea]|uniref:DUF4260 family protein n=1 Tax=Halostella litorea TaxID=2528831 RepID=UPI001092341D|nr:DUF4260 family protein [Halostella litorea]
MEPRTVLRVEGLAVLALALAGYAASDGPLWLLLALALAPDLSMLGYLAGPRFGSASYDLVHTYTLSLALGVAGLWVDGHAAVLVALVWTGHIGADRFFGYGRKFESGFEDTHLSAQPVPVSALTESE